MTTFNVRCQHCGQSDDRYGIGDLVIVGTAEWSFVCLVCEQTNRQCGNRKVMSMLTAAGVRTDWEIARDAMADIRVPADMFPL